MLVCEISIRFSNLVDTNKRSLMFSCQPFQLDQNGAVRFQPNKHIRTVAVYNNKIEYDVNFDSNNLGFIDDKDYKYENLPNKRYYAFVGDSFTAGFHGGEPWVPKLRRSFEGKDIEIFNLGVNGTGIEHFCRLLKSTSKQLHITHIVILGISDDFTRNFWYPHPSSSEIRFCPENMHGLECAKRNPIAKIIDPTSSIKDILKVAGNIEKENSIHRSPIKAILKQSELLSVVKLFKRNLQKKKRNTRISSSFDALRNIKEEFPSAKMYFIHLPQKQEVVKGEYFLDNLGKEIETIGISYFPALKELHWKKDMFFVNDAHPNNRGYDNIRNGVSSYLFH